MLDRDQDGHVKVFCQDSISRNSRITFYGAHVFSQYMWSKLTRLT
jgi:hypothetical protein